MTLKLLNAAVFFVIFLFPAAIFWGEVLYLLTRHLYKATQVTWFYMMVLWHVRKQPENYGNLDPIYKYPLLIVGQWFSILLYGRDFKEGYYVETKAAGTKYYFRGWRLPIIKPCTEPSLPN